jgi:hypothetical protein
MSQVPPLSPQPESQPSSYTARPTPDTVGLGRTAGQRTAEIFAGLRAELMPSEETRALSRMSGRVIARLMMGLGRPELFNFVPVRLGGFHGLIHKHLPTSPPVGTTIVEIGAGFSPRGLQLARALPQALVIEVDLPDVIEEKQKRLSKMADGTLPANLTWRTADLGVTPLADVLEGMKVDMVVAEGLLPYFTHEEIPAVGGHVRASLRPGGTFIADLGYTSPEGEQQARKVVSMFRRQTRTTPGSVTDEATAQRLFAEAGYDRVTLYRMPDIAEMFDLPRPAPDVLFFMVGQTSPAD